MSESPRSATIVSAPTGPVAGGVRFSLLAGGSFSRHRYLWWRTGIWYLAHRALSPLPAVVAGQVPPSGWRSAAGQSHRRGSARSAASSHRIYAAIIGASRREPVLKPRRHTFTWCRACRVPQSRRRLPGVVSPCRAMTRLELSHQVVRGNIRLVIGSGQVRARPGFHAEPSWSLADRRSRFVQSVNAGNCASGSARRRTRVA